MSFFLNEHHFRLSYSRSSFYTIVSNFRNFPDFPGHKSIFPQSSADFKRNIVEPNPILRKIAAITGDGYNKWCAMQNKT
jgi:hypothetical protein